MNENENVVIARCGIQCMRGICHKDVGELSRDDDWMQRKGKVEGGKITRMRRGGSLS